jgi:hypothetical protein
MAMILINSQNEIMKAAFFSLAFGVDMKLRPNLASTVPRRHPRNALQRVHQLQRAMGVTANTVAQN